MDFYDLFEIEEEYPKNIAERGVPNDTIFTYISSTFLNGLINYVSPFWGCILERYRIWEKLYKNDWEKLIDNSFHPNLNNFGDDVLILAETSNYFWFFWFDCDVSDCQIGKINKTITTKDKMIKLLITWIKSHKFSIRQKNTEAIVGNYYELPKEYLTKGWISF